MGRAAPAVPYAWSQQPISAAMWNQYQYAVGFHIRPPFALLLQNTMQSVPSVTPTRILFDNPVRDSDAGHSTTANPSRYTAPIPGLYHICVFGSLLGGSTAGGERSLSIVLNGGAYWAMHLLAPTSYGNGSFGGSVQAEIPMNTGDYVEASFYQDSGTTLSTQNSYSQARMGVRWVGN